jgi:membrane-associated phospholipid phosphatase
LLARSPRYIAGAILMLVGVSAALLLFLAAVRAIAEPGVVPDVDTRVQELVSSILSPRAIRLTTWITALGSTPVMTALTIALGIFLLRRGSWSHLAEMLVAIPLGTAALFVMKAFFQRARPVEALFEVRGLSFPSGHAFISVVFFGFIAYLLSRSQLHRIWIVAGASLCLVLIALIGTSRVYLGVHFLTDVVGGYSAGFLWLVFSLLLVRVVERGRSARRSGRDDPEGEPGVSGG